MEYYHGSPILFDEFDTSYSKCDEDIYVSPCKVMSMAYATGRDGEGYLYTIEIDESEVEPKIRETCGCLAFSDVSKFKIVNVEKVDSGKSLPVAKAECGRFVVKQSRK